MWVMVEHLHKEKRSGIFRYRRRVPPELQGVLGKKMFDISLKTKDPEAARRKRDKVHREINAQLAKVSSGEPAQREYEQAKRVLVIADDEEGRTNTFSYGKYLGFAPLSDTDRRNIADTTQYYSSPCFHNASTANSGTLTPQMQNALTY